MLPKYGDIVDLLKKGSTIEAQEKIMELREAAIALQEENIELKQKTNELEELLARKGNMTFKTPFYYAEEDDIPFCPRCWEVEHKAVHLPAPFNSAAGPNYRCPNCKVSIVVR